MSRSLVYIGFQAFKIVWWVGLYEFMQRTTVYLIKQFNEIIEILKKKNRESRFRDGEREKNQKERKKIKINSEK